MSAVNFNNQEIALMNSSFIVPKYINAPNTVIQNRAQVLDSSNMLQTVMGVERIPFRGINLLQKEFGANGEQVYELESKDARVRFVGSISMLNNVDGFTVNLLNTSSFIEVSFYGTGINLGMYLSASAWDLRISVDGGAEGSNIYTYGSSASGILNGRNYSANNVVNAVSGLSPKPIHISNNPSRTSLYW
jgi:hypothetical protein